MKLYKKENGKIKVYTLFPNEEEIIKYKKGEMNNIPKEEQVCKAVTRVGHYGYPVFLEHEDEFDTFTFSMDDVNGIYHKLLNEENAYERNFYLEQYYNAKYLDGRVAKVMDLNLMKYFLLKQLDYRHVLYDKNVNAGIIQVPESLYLLHLIETEKFSLLGDKDVSEQLNMFKVYFDHEIDIHTIGKMNDNGMAPKCMARVLKKVENDENIFNKFQGR